MSDVQRKENRKILSGANNERAYQKGGAIKKKNSAPGFKFKMPASRNKPKDIKMPASRNKPKDTKMPSKKFDITNPKPGTKKKFKPSSKQAGGAITTPGKFKQIPKPAKRKAGVKIEMAQEGFKLPRMGTYPPGYMDSVLRVRAEPRLDPDYKKSEPSGYLTGQEWGERYDPGFTIKDTVPGGWGNKYDPGMTIKDTVPGGWGNKYDPGFTRKLPPVQFPKSLGGNNPQQYQMGGVMRWLKKQAPEIMEKGHRWIAKNYPDQYMKYFPQTPSTKVIPPQKALPGGRNLPVPVPKPGPVVPVPKPGPLVPIPGPIKPPTMPSGGRRKYPWWMLPIVGAGIYGATREDEHPTEPPVTEVDPRDIEETIVTEPETSVEETIVTEPETSVEDRGEAPPGRPSFDISFMEARNAGLAEFDWMGPDNILRRYHTRTAEEDAMYKSQQASRTAGPFTMDPLSIDIAQELDTTLAGPAPEVQSLAENLAGREGASRRRYFKNDRQEIRKGARILYDRGTGKRKTSKKIARRDRKELKREVKGIMKEDRRENKASKKEQKGIRKADKKARKNERGK